MKSTSYIKEKLEKGAKDSNAFNNIICVAFNLHDFQDKKSDLKLCVL